MREAIGGTWLLGIVVIFIALFSSFLFFSINYTRAFNLKNTILNIIEQEEGFTTLPDGKSVDSLEPLDLEKASEDYAEARIFQAIRDSGYDYTTADNIDCSTTLKHPRNNIAGESTMQVGGYCLTKICPEKRYKNDGDKKTKEVISGTDSRTYYRVTTFIAATIPVVNITLNIPITGETRTLFYDYGGTDCYDIAELNDALHHVND